jgi:dethiobiotin synthetase
MTDFLILGTDTDAGKTTFAALWLAGFADGYEYWKPVESGDSDTERLRRLVPAAAVHAPQRRFRDAVAPPLAARREGAVVPPASAIAAAKPAPRQPGRHLAIETFGSPLSPLNGAELQIELVRALAVPAVLVSSSSVGAVGRTLQCLQALAGQGILPAAVVLVGPPDEFAAGQIERYGSAGRVFSLRPPSVWDAEGVAVAEREQRAVLEAVRACLAPSPAERGLDVEDLLERDRRYVWHPYTSLREPDAPLVCVGARNEFLELADGRRVIDAISSWWTILHGHRHPS